MKHQADIKDKKGIMKKLIIWLYYINNKHKSSIIIRKPYCDFCKFHRHGMPLLDWDDRIIFKDKSVHLGYEMTCTDVCVHNIVVNKKTEENEVIQGYKYKEYQVNDPYKLNKNNNCPFYKQSYLKIIFNR